MRESCIHHPTQQPVAIVRQDYYYLMNRDTIAAAILNIFEYWANGAIATQGNKAAENPWVGIHTIPEIQELLVGIATDKHIRERLKTLEENGFIERRKSRLGGRSYEYRFNIKAVQESLETLAKSGQTTAINPVKRPQSIRSNDRNNPVKRPEQSGQTTGTIRSNDRITIYKKDQENKKNNKKGDKDKKTTPQKTEILNFESSNSDPISEIVEHPENKNSISLVETQACSSDQNSAAPLTRDEELALAVKAKYHNTGILPRIPMEIEAWVQYDLGTDLIALYRESGRITTRKRGDINPGFAKYVASQYEGGGKDIDYGFRYIKSLEWGERMDWETLAAYVRKWQLAEQSNNTSLNLVQEVTVSDWMQTSINNFNAGVGNDWL